jgi:hypothetical protein
MVKKYTDGCVGAENELLVQKLNICSVYVFIAVSDLACLFGSLRTFYWCYTGEIKGFFRLTKVRKSINFG